MNFLFVTLILVTTTFHRCNLKVFLRVLMGTLNFTSNLADYVKFFFDQVVSHHHLVFTFASTYLLQEVSDFTICYIYRNHLSVKFDFVFITTAA